MSLIEYKLIPRNNNQHFINIYTIIDCSYLKGDYIELCLPSWRPGRYEIGNFAKNIRNWKVIDENECSLHSKKISKDKWEICRQKAKKIIISYEYYAPELNAGSTYSDNNQLYVNPVNCLLYLSK